MNNDRAPALTEGLRILELVGDSPEGNSFETILKNVNMSRSSVNRLLKNLVNSGYLTIKAGLRGIYYPGPRLFSLSYQVNTNHKTMEAIHSSLQDLAQKTLTSTQYAIFDRTFARIIVLDKAETPGSIHLVGAGTDITRYANRHGLGKIILAHCTPEERESILSQVEHDKKTSHTILPGPQLDRLIEEVRDQGYATDIEESDTSVYRVAVGVFDGKGTILGGICCTWHSGQEEKGRVSLAHKELEKISEMLFKLSVSK